MVYCFLPSVSAFFRRCDGATGVLLHVRSPGALYVVHAVFMGISLFISALLPVRMGSGFSGGFIDLVLGWVNPMAQNPWMIPLMGVFWFAVYFVVFRFIILKFNLKTPGRR